MKVNKKNKKISEKDLINQSYYSLILTNLKKKEKDCGRGQSIKFRRESSKNTAEINLLLCIRNSGLNPSE